MRLVPILSAALILASLPALADNRSGPEKASTRLVVAVNDDAKPQIVASGIWEEDFTDRAGREWRRTYRANGDWKEFWTDGSCRIERGETDGRFAETVTC